MDLQSSVPPQIRRTKSRSHERISRQTNIRRASSTTAARWVISVVVFWLWLTASGTLAASTESEIASWIVDQGGTVTKDKAGRLVSVDLTSTWVTDSDLVKITHLIHLQKLNLSHTKITDIGLEQLKPLKDVTSLNLYYAEYITDSGIAHLQGWRKLEHLTLRGTQISSRVFEHIAPLVNLKSLDVGFTTVSDEGFEHLSVLTNLEKLICGGNRINGTALPLLRLLPSLTHLDVGGTQRADSGLWGLPLTDANLQRLAELERLQVLALGGATLADSGLDRPERVATRRELQLAKLKSLVNLESLDLSRLPVSSRSLGVLTRLPHLRHLNLALVQSIDDKAVPVFLAMKRLRVLYLTETSISDDGLELLQGMEQLKRVSLGGSKVSRAGVERFRKARPDCHVSWREKSSLPDAQEKTPSTSPL